MWAICSTTRFVIKNAFLRTGARYTTDGKAGFVELYKMLQAIENRKKWGDHKEPLNEGGPNWELFNPKGNRFFLPNSVGPAWQTPRTIENDIDLFDYIDFNSEDPDKFHVSIQPCPALIKNRFKNIIWKAQTLITLYYQKDTELEYSARNFVQAATEICRRMNYDGYACDFLNPFSGKPFFDIFGTNAVVNMEGYPFKYKNSDGCTMVTSDVGKKFYGIIFCNVKCDELAILHAIQTNLPTKRLMMEYNSEDDEDDDDDDY